jgi:hypothetical protein
MLVSESGSKFAPGWLLSFSRSQAPLGTALLEALLLLREQAELVVWRAQAELGHEMDFA